MTGLVMSIIYVWTSVAEFIKLNKNKRANGEWMCQPCNVVMFYPCNGSLPCCLPFDFSFFFISIDTCVQQCPTSWLTNCCCYQHFEIFKAINVFIIPNPSWFLIRIGAISGIHELLFSYSVWYIHVETKGNRNYFQSSIFQSLLLCCRFQSQFYT